ncbi:hypothetical protein [Bacillus subtilis]|uniref:hypothetical protein n=1 Tax=Bacillus subtilis TaxID=1423 RepID=UPI0013631C9F|nr:hypothetical protein [Bacillus subtilis]QHM08336.1 hypothetical protein C7M28_00043 [Bacillus subtilis]
MMLFIKKHTYPITVIILILCIVATLIIFHKQLAPFSNILSAMIGALLGSMGPYFIGLQNQRNEFIGAKRKMISLLVYTYNAFNPKSIESYLNAPVQQTHGRVIYDNQWTNYISFLDKYLTFGEIQEIAYWFERISVLESNVLNEVEYHAELKNLEEVSSNIKKIIEKLINN